MTGSLVFFPKDVAECAAPVLGAIGLIRGAIIIAAFIPSLNGSLARLPIFRVFPTRATHTLCQSWRRRRFQIRTRGTRTYHNSTFSRVLLVSKIENERHSAAMDNAIFCPGHSGARATTICTQASGTVLRHYCFCSILFHTETLNTDTIAATRPFLASFRLRKQHEARARKVCGR